MNTTTQEQKAVEKGNIFYTSWGYDQTNYDFMAVLSVSSSGKTAKCQMIHRLHMGTESQTNVQEPIFCPYGDVFTMRIKQGYRGDVVLRGSYPYCNNGSIATGTRLDTFSAHKEGKQYHETMAEFGH